jgi:hypothetical protein
VGRRRWRSGRWRRGRRRMGWRKGRRWRRTWRYRKPMWRS